MTEQFGSERVQDVSDAFDLLRDARRRGVLYTVARKGRTHVSEIARRISAWQSTRGEEVDASAVETALVHSHLPKLEDAGVIEYDTDDRTVDLTDSASDLEPFLQCTREREPSLFRAARTPDVERVIGAGP